MGQVQSRSYSVAVVPSDRDPRCYDWIIRSPDGRCVARSSYAFATRPAARLAGECSLHAVIDIGSVL
ncbi:hypothetical protein MMR14E_18995 [Methylobacterium mesophilicum]